MLFLYQCSSTTRVPQHWWCPSARGPTPTACSRENGKASWFPSIQQHRAMKASPYKYRAREPRAGTCCSLHAETSLEYPLALPEVCLINPWLSPRSQCQPHHCRQSRPSCWQGSSRSVGPGAAQTPVGTDHLDHTDATTFLLKFIVYIVAQDVLEPN